MINANLNCQKTKIAAYFSIKHYISCSNIYTCQDSNNFGSVSGTLGRLTVAGECMASLHKCGCTLALISCLAFPSLYDSRGVHLMYRPVFQSPLNAAHAVFQSPLNAVPAVYQSPLNAVPACCCRGQQ